MPDIITNIAAAEMVQGGTPIDFLNDDIQMGLATDTFVEDQDDTVADDGSADDFASGEVSGTGYAAGYGGAGRQSLTSKTITVDNANNRVDIDAADVTFTGIDVGAVDKAVLLLEDHLGVAGNDTETRIISSHDSGFPVTTNGGDLTVQTPNDLIRLTT